MLATAMELLNKQIFHLIDCLHTCMPVASLRLVSPGPVIAAPTPQILLTFLNWKISQFLIFYANKF